MLPNNIFFKSHQMMIYLSIYFLEIEYALFYHKINFDSFFKKEAQINVTVRHLQ